MIHDPASEVLLDRRQQGRREYSSVATPIKGQDLKSRNGRLSGRHVDTQNMPEGETQPSGMSLVGFDWSLMLILPREPSVFMGTPPKCVGWMWFSMQTGLTPRRAWACMI
jgi:hypothetical protein